MIATTFPSAPVTDRQFGRLPDGWESQLYTLKNRCGFQADITEHGGIIVRLFAPDNAGRLADVVLGFDEMVGYLEAPRYFGAIFGRVANDMGGAQFALDGRVDTSKPDRRPKRPRRRQALGFLKRTMPGLGSFCGGCAASNRPSNQRPVNVPSSIKTNRISHETKTIPH